MPVFQQELVSKIPGLVIAAEVQPVPAASFKEDTNIVLEDDDGNDDFPRRYG